MIFDDFLTSREIGEVFADRALIGDMLRFEAALAAAQARHGVIPAAAAARIAACCRAERYDSAAIVDAARRAGSLAIPLVKQLTQAVERIDPAAAGFVHWGATSQDVIDTAAALATQRALALVDRDLERLIRALDALAERHADTPLLARTLLQPAQVISFGLKVTGWLAPLVRSRIHLRASAARALALQLGGAVGTLSALGARAPQVAASMAAELGLALPAAPWHTQRDEWLRLGLEVALLAGNLGKLATDLALLAQAEVGEVAEPAGRGRGGSSTMPHKRNPVAALAALAASVRAPQRAAALLAAMNQQHERGLGNWQAELAEWPALMASAHGALAALAGAVEGLQVDAARMRANIDAQRGLVFAEAVSMHLASAIGRARAHALMEELSARALASGRPLGAVVEEAIAADAALASLDRTRLRELFDADAAARFAGERARQRLLALRATELPPAPWSPSPPPLSHPARGEKA
jgi:3-carboxy-cis,cis-muconate cycloisomerase